MNRKEGSDKARRKKKKKKKKSNHRESLTLKMRWQGLSQEEVGEEEKRAKEMSWGICSV